MPLRSAFLACALPFALLAAAAEADAIGVVKSATGNVFIERGAAVLPVAVGDAVELRDTITTGDDGACGVILDDGTRLSISADSSFAVAAYDFEPSRGLFNLVVDALFGRIVYGSGRIAEADPDKVRIETPQLTVGIRGTEFAVVLPRPQE